ncbi:MAG TPA: PAS domain-containing protein [Polyangium sp.]|nr:PAS domain-containing protein [Polyangium sp.]
MNEAGLSSAAFAAFPEPVAVVVADGSPKLREANASWTATFADGAAVLASPEVADALAKIFGGQTNQIEAKFVGAEADHALVIVRMRGGDQPMALVHARRVPRVPETKFDEDAALLHRILDCLPVSVTVADGAGKKLFSNMVATTHFGSADADTGMGILDALVDAADVGFAQEVATRVLATGAEEIITSDVQTTHGIRSMFYHVIPVDGPQAKEKLLVYVGRDVSEQLRAERDVREQQDFIRQVIDSDPNLIFVKDARGNFILVNRAAAAIFGKTPEEVVGQHDAELNNDKAFTDGYFAEDRHVLATLDERTVEERVRWFTGEERWYQTTKRPLVLPNGDVQVLGFSVDITARRETLQRLEEAAAEVERRAAEAFRQAEAKAALVEDLDQKLGIIEAQHQEILALSAPLLDVGERVLAVPIVGALTAMRTIEIMTRLLNAIVERQVERVVVDLTGLETIEMDTAEQLMGIIRAIRLLGSEAVITGIRPAVAQTIVELGIDLSAFNTKRTLRSALLDATGVGGAAWTPRVKNKGSSR